MTSKLQTDKTIQWLLDEDPAIRWQVLRDLVEAPERTVERERTQAARESGPRPWLPLNFAPLAELEK